MTQRILEEWLIYWAAAGLFTWRKSPAPHIKAGSIAGSVTKRGYVKVGFNGQSFLAHRLAWLWVYGEWPSNTLDHRNLSKTDNRIKNLREATQMQQNANRRTARNGLKGAHFNQTKGKWQARITINRRTIHLGCFDTEKAAHAAYMDAARQHFGDFAYTGIP